MIEKGCAGDVIVLCKVAGVQVHVPVIDDYMKQNILTFLYIAISIMRPAHKKKKEKMSEEIQPSRWREKLEGRLAMELQGKANESKVQQFNQNMGADMKNM